MGEGSGGPCIAIVDCPCGVRMQLPLDAAHTMAECSNCGRVLNGYYEHDGDPPMYRYTWAPDMFCDPEDHARIDPEDVHVKPLSHTLPCDCGTLVPVRKDDPHQRIQCPSCGCIAEGESVLVDGYIVGNRFVWKPSEPVLQKPPADSNKPVEAMPCVSDRQRTDEQIRALNRVMGKDVSERLDRLLASFGPAAIDAAEQRIIDNSTRDIRRFFEHYRTTRYLQDEKPADPMTPDELGDAFRG